MGAAYLAGPPVKPPKKRQGCTGKVGYSTKEIANKIIREWRTGGITLFKYECKFCSRWHLTKLNQGKIK